MLDLAQLITALVMNSGRCALAVMYADETRHHDSRAVRLGFSKNDAPAAIAKALRKKCFELQFKPSVFHWPNGNFEKVARELILRGSSACIGFDVAGDISCHFFGEPSEWEILIDTIEDKIRKLEPQFGTLA